jgi:hypothetical protein
MLKGGAAAVGRDEVVLDATRKIAFFHPSEIRAAGSMSGPTA